MSSAVDDLAHALARRQHGAFALHQVRDAGGDSALAHRRVRAGRWVRIDRGVYLLPGHAGTWEQRAMAATLGHPRAVLSGRAAAALWGLDGFRPGGLQVTVPRATHHRSDLATVRRSDVVDRTTHSGIPVNSLALVLVEVAAFSAARFPHAVEGALISRRIDVDLLRDVHLRWAPRGVPGTATLRRFLETRADGEPIPESMLEVAGRRLLTHPDIPPFQLQATFPWAPAGPQRVDFLIPAWRIIVECDGRLWHARLDAMEADARRDRVAAAHGYLTVRLGHTTIIREMAQCRADLIAAGRLRVQ